MQNRRTEIVPAVDWQKCAVAAWSAVAVIITIRLLTAANIERHSIYPDYIGAARHWLHGISLYGPERREFRYSPLFAAAFTPFTIFPDRVGNIVWRGVNLAAYLAALRWWMSLALPPAEDRNLRGLFLLLALPLSVGSFNNGQANPLMVALILGAFVSVESGRWLLASAFLVLAVHLKLYPLAFALVLLVLWPRELWWRLLLVGLLSVGLCFVAQSPGYVAAQFRDWFGFLSRDLRLDQAPENAYRDLRLLLRVTALDPGHTGYLILQLLGAAAVAAGSLALKRCGVPGKQMLVLVCAVTSCWILLLGPATESATYILLAPLLAWLLITAWTKPRPNIMRIALIVATALLGLAMIANWFPFVSKVHALGLHPLAVLIFLGCVVYDAISSARSRSFDRIGAQPVV